MDILFIGYGIDFIILIIWMIFYNKKISGKLGVVMFAFLVFLPYLIRTIVQIKRFRELIKPAGKILEESRERLNLATAIGDRDSAESHIEGRFEGSPALISLMSGFIIMDKARVHNSLNTIALSMKKTEFQMMITAEFENNKNENYKIYIWEQKRAGDKHTKEEDIILKGLNKEGLNQIEDEETRNFFIRNWESISWLIKNNFNKIEMTALEEGTQLTAYIGTYYIKKNEVYIDFMKTALSQLSQIK